jgi:hypothetical protein
MKTARTQLMESTRGGDYTSLQRVKMAEDFKARAKEEGIISVS